ncbi:MAG: ABC transporter ATP-binding protein [Acidobacteria bacterium]|nr:ABC transporter ATP-binding protein [Acidobacteriota bacterium]
MIRVDDLKKNYGQHVAVDGISFQAAKGEIFGLLGPNGAGKTTTISIISGLLEATSGTVTVDGRTMSPTASSVKKVMGVVPQETALYEELTARENLRFWGGLYDMSGSRLKKRVGEVLELIGLIDRSDDAVKTYSGGMKRRLNLGLGLVHEPRLLLLDEPTVGVDPQARLSILDVIREAARNGTTVLYTTHYMQEAEELCQRLAILDHGKILAEGTVDELKKMVGEGEIVTVRGSFTAQQMHRALEGHPHVHAVSLEDHQAMLSVAGDGGTARLLQDLLGQDLEVNGVNVQPPSLEQVFIKLTGRELRD